MKLPDPKKPIQTTVSPWEVAFGQKVDADRLIQEDKEWLESRQRLMDARKRDDAKLLAQAEKKIPKDVYLSDGKNFITQEQRDQSLKNALEKGLVTAPALGALGASSVSWLGPATRMLIEGTKSIPAIASMAGVGAGTEMLEDKPTPLGALAKAAQWAATTRMPISEVLTYTGDAEAGGLQKMLQMMYRGRSSFTPIEERAMFMSPTPRYAEEYAKRRVGQIGGDRMVDSYLVDPFGVERRGHNITPEGGGNLQSIIAYPKTGEAEYMGSRKFAKGGLARLASRLAADSAPARRGVADVVKEKGGNWLSGSVENSLSGLKKRMDPELEGYARRGQNLIPHEAADVLPKIAINNFIDKQLTKYVRNDMATPGDPIRALAERGVLHFEPDWVPEGSFSRGQAAGLTGGKSGRRMGKGRLAQDWEDLTDQGIDQMRAGEAWSPRGDVKVDNPWLSKVDSDSPVYAMPKEMEESLGFNHLIDELSNAINPESGLPRHLQFPVNRLDKVSVPQAVERVAQINAWRAAQKAEADAMRANNAATHLHKEYPEKGMKWVELRKGDTLPEGYTVEPNSTYFDKTGFQLRDAKGARYGLPQPSEQEALAQLEALRGRQALEDALKYEGDTMGHCVGGYCDDVLSGRSRIYSLRDAKGQPHVTIEVAPSATLTPEKREAQLGHLVQRLIGEGKTEEQALREAVKLYPESETYSKIVQIKGKGNAKPIDEYLPFVQDFVKSGQWSDVGDLQNSGLKYYPKQEAIGPGVILEPGYYSQEEIAKKLTDARVPEVNQSGWLRGQGFSSGGSIQAKPVKTVQDIQAVINSLSERQFHA